MIANPTETTTTLTGLSNDEVIARRKRGQGNTLRLKTSRSYAEIFQSNVLNPINLILFVIGAIMIAIGRIGDAVTSVGLIVLNVVIGIYQEVRAKRQLDEIALLTRPRITVLRGGEDHSVDPSELVVGDVIHLTAGDQIVVDGRMLEGRVEVDESLLTGESDLIPKLAGDEVLSGSFVVAGAGYFEAVRVGADSFANKLTASAREFQIAHTPLQREINFILRLLLFLAGFLGVLMLISAALSNLPLVRQVQMAAVIAGLIPNGLLFMVVLAYAMGALRIVRVGALVQQTNAVESLSNVTVLCVDKTGTLTANRIRYRDALPIGLDKAALERILGDFAHSITAPNKTSEALREGLPGSRLPLLDEVPFSSSLKWSALALDAGGLRGVYVMGAVEMLSQYLTLPDDVQAQMQQWSDEGLRVLIFAHNPHVLTLRDVDDEPTLPALTPLAALCFDDELRPHLTETLAGFRKSGIALKVISGDNPKTVAALARQAGFPRNLKYISGPELNELDDAQLRTVAEEMTVFGRITPEQKERLVGALRASGHYVAMIGDGVNDVLSLKKADMGIAMESGSAATRAVADMILLKDSFGALPPAFLEGQRIINGMKDVLSLFLTRILYAALMIVSTAVIGVGFPYIPKHNALLILLSVGIPTLGLAIWARPGPTPRGSMLLRIARFVLPAGFSIFVFGLLIYVTTFFANAIHLIELEVTEEDIRSFQEYAGIDYAIVDATAYVLEVSHLAAQTTLTIFSTFTGLLLVVFVEPPIRFFVAGDDFSGDWRPTLLAGFMLLCFLVIMIVEPIRRFFELIPLPLEIYGVLVLVTIVWMFALRWAWRVRLLERFLGIELP